MRKLRVAATSLGLFIALLPAMAAQNAANTGPAATVAKPKAANINAHKRHVQRTHRAHAVRHRRRHQMALHKVHRKHLVDRKKHHIPTTAKPAA
jgi:hypothetical protein